MRVLFVTLGTRAVPSSRIRVHQYADRLRAEGLEVRVVPYALSERYERFLNDVMRLKQLPRLAYYPLRLAREAAWRIGLALDRVRLFLELAGSDLVVVQKVVLPAPYRVVLRTLRRKYLFDFDDAIFADTLPHRQESLRSARRRVRGIESFAARAAAVVTNDNPALEAWAAAHGRRAVVLPAAVERRFQASLPRETDGAGVRLGWVGLRVNFHNLVSISPALDAVARLRPGVRLRIVWGGGERPALETSMAVEYEPWSYEREVELGRSFDIGLLPLVEDDFNRGKMARKAIEYAALGTPAVCSPVGLNLRLFRDEENVLLANTTDEWTRDIVRLVDDPSLRERLGRAAAATAEANYGFEAIARRLLALLRVVAPGPTRSRRVAPAR